MYKKDHLKEKKIFERIKNIPDNDFDKFQYDYGYESNAFDWDFTEDTFCYLTKDEFIEALIDSNTDFEYLDIFLKKKGY